MLWSAIRPMRKSFITTPWRQFNTQNLAMDFEMCNFHINSNAGLRLAMVKKSKNLRVVFEPLKAPYSGQSTVG
jgi:hypothetical protein